MSKMLKAIMRGVLLGIVTAIIIGGAAGLISRAVTISNTVNDLQRRVDQLEQRQR